MACHVLASLRATGARNPRLLAAGPSGWLRVQGREGALSAPGEGSGLGAGSGAARLSVSVEWRWLPSLRGSHLASCVGRRTARSTYTASLRRATEPRLCEREARGVGARQRAVAERQRSVPLIGLRAQRADVDVARENGGGGPRRRAERGGACPPPPSILREALTFGGRGVLAEPARPSHRGPGTRRAASAGAGEA